MYQIDFLNGGETKAELFHHKWLSTKKIVITFFMFCNCLFASAKSLIIDRSDSDLLNCKRRIIPIYRDNVFYKYVAGNVLFVIGTSSSGKSSIVTKLSKHIPHEKKGEFLISGHDNWGENFVLKRLRNKLVGEGGSITKKDLWYCFSAMRVMPRESILARLDTDKILKKHKQLLLSDEWFNALSQLQFLQFSTEEILSSAESLMLNVANGKNVILDVISFEPFLFALERNFIRCKSYNIYTYSSLRTIKNRIIQRSQESLLTADKKDMRLSLPYDQYLDLYTSCYFNTGMSLTKKEISPDFTDILHSIIEGSELSDPEKNHLMPILKKNEDYEKYWRKRINLEWFPADTEVIYLKPKCPKVDLLLDTSVLSTDDAVSFILPILNSLTNG